MQLLIAGVTHFDPLCKSHLEQWLMSIANRPAFIAVEWGELIFEAVKAQREQFRIDAANRWATCPTDVIDALTAGLGFEADTHELIFPNVSVIWLDNHRDIGLKDNRVVNYADDRLRIYDQWLGNDLSACAEADILNDISVGVWQSVDFSSKADIRDIEFAKEIESALHQADEKNVVGVAVVGANHASENRGSLTYLLREKGIDCQVTMLTP